MLLEAARASVADALGLRPAEVSFTPSLTDAAHRAIAGRLLARPDPAKVRDVAPRIRYYLDVGLLLPP